MTDPVGLRQVRTGTARRTTFSIPRPLRRLSGPLALLLIWWIVTATGMVGPQTFPRVGEVWDIGVDLFRSGDLQSAMWASGKRVFVGLAIGVSSGLFVAVLAGSSRRAEDVLDSGMQVLKAIPTFSLVPLLIIWLGIDEAPKIAIIALATSMPIYMNTYGAIRNVDLKLVEAAQTLGVGRVGLVRHVIVPGSLPGFLVGLRLSLTSAWLSLVIAEQINAKDGLGRLMAEARNWFRLDLMVLIVVIYATLGLLSYSFVRFLERHLLQWRRGYEGA